MATHSRSLHTVLVALLTLSALLTTGCGGLDGTVEQAQAAATESAGAATGSSASSEESSHHVPSLEVRVVGIHPHRKDAFTQGLLFDDGVLYESTGQHGESSLRKVDPATGGVLEERDLPARYFAEGLALVPGDQGARGDQLIQLTWQSGVALVWERAGFAPAGRHEYDGEGWGLTFDGHHLVMSDGSSWLTFRDPETFEEISRVQVTLEGHPLAQLNELEWVDGSVWANVWGSTVIVRIDPASGVVTATADLGVLYQQIDPAEAQGMDVLNGIAYRPGTGEGGVGNHGDDGVFLVTGKYWPRLFEVTFEPPRG